MPHDYKEILDEGYQLWENVETSVNICKLFWENDTLFNEFKILQEWIDQDNLTQVQQQGLENLEKRMQQNGLERNLADLSDFLQVKRQDFTEIAQNYQEYLPNRTEELIEQLQLIKVKIHPFYLIYQKSVLAEPI